MTHTGYNVDIVCRPRRSFLGGKFSPDGVPICHCSLARRQLGRNTRLISISVASQTRRPPDRLEAAKGAGVPRKSTKCPFGLGLSEALCEKYLNGQLPHKDDLPRLRPTCLVKSSAVQHHTKD
jgi:hypothetical protein